ncbi:MAG: LacI family DNA-binding transcriptional regulator [Rhodoluna sp.]|nr:LacI family DNA-binding transcriptional regulator [Rhodoluna sp.]
MVPAQRPTYSVIAKAAGVSEATVSRVLNGDESVHPDRAKRVQDAVDKLGYRKNRVASALASGRSGLIAVVIDDDLSVFSDPFWGTVTSGVSRILSENGLHTVLMVSPVGSVDGGVAHYLKSGEVDGAIFFVLHSDALVNNLKKTGLPMVITGTPHSSMDIPFVDTDNFGGAYSGTKHLINQGCKKIACITGDIGTTAAKQRLDGYLQAFRETGGIPAKGLICEGDYSLESGMHHARMLLETHPDVDGIFASNDLMAAGAVTVLQDLGRLVPEDVKVVGFDDALIAQTTRPALTTIRQDVVALGEAAGSLMIAQLNGEDVKPIITPTELIIRASA